MRRTVLRCFFFAVLRQPYWVTLAILHRAISSFPRGDAKPQKRRLWLATAGNWEAGLTADLDPLSRRCNNGRLMRTHGPHTVPFLPDSAFSFALIDGTVRHMSRCGLKRAREISVSHNSTLRFFKKKN